MSKQDNINPLTGIPYQFCIAKKKNGDVCGATARIGPYCLRHVLKRPVNVDPPHEE